MKKIVFGVTAALAALLCVLVCACKQSSAPVVGTYKLVSVVMSNGVNNSSYTAGDEANPLVTENSFVLEIKADYRWNMIIQLPGVSETEDGKWEDNNGSYVLTEDKDDPKIPLTFADNKLSLTMSEDGYVMSVVLKKV